VLPVIGRKYTVADRMAAQPAAGLIDRSYAYGLIKLLMEGYAIQSEDVQAVRKRYPYLKADYIANDMDGGLMPGFIDITWEPDSYPLRLMETIIRTMKAEADRRGVRFWVALPITQWPAQLPFFRELASKHGIAVIDPVANGLQKEWFTKCNNFMVFKTDGHLNACAHRGQATSIAQALAK
jgi:hypothetical protein